MYCTLDDIREAGITENQASDAQITAAIAEATYEIDRTTGRWFEARNEALRATGSGLSVIELDGEPIEITSVTVDDVELDSEYYEIVPSSVSGKPNKPEVRRTYGVWSDGATIVVTGTFGYVDDPGATNTTPLPIKRACRKLTIKFLLPVTTSLAAEDAILSERHRDYSYAKSEKVKPARYGDRDIDDILADFKKREMRVA